MITNEHELFSNIIIESNMKKKDYMKPALCVVKIQHKRHILVSTMQTTGLDDDLTYDPNGGDQSQAWGRGHRSVWDDEDGWNDEDE